MRRFLQQLPHEFKRLTGFRFPDDVRKLCSQAQEELSDPNLKLPITTPNSPSVLAYELIAPKEKIYKYTAVITHLVLEAISSNTYSVENTVLLTNGIVDILPISDDDLSLRVIQNVANWFSNNLHYSLYQNYFSILITLVSHKSPIISSTAFACFQQCLSNFVDNIKTDNLEEMASYLKTNFGSLVEAQENPYHTVLALLFQDISNLSVQEPVKWLKAKFSSPPDIYELLEMIITTSKDLLLSNPNLACIFDGALIQLMGEQKAIQFVISFVEAFHATHESLMASVFRDFLSRLIPHTSLEGSAMYFFHYLCFSTSLFELCRIAGTELTKSLFTSLLEFSLKAEPRYPIELPMKRQKISVIQNDLFVERAPFEIAIKSIQEVSKRDYGLSAHIGSELTQIITLAVRYCEMPRYDLVLESISNLIRILSKSGNSDLLPAIRVFGDLDGVWDSATKGFNLEEKKQKWPGFVSNCVEKYPNSFESIINSLITSLYKTGSSLPDPSFCAKLSPESQKSLISNMISSNPPPFEYVAGCSSYSDFPTIFPAFKELINSQSALRMFAPLCRQCLRDDTQVLILQAANEIIKLNNMESPLVFRTILDSVHRAHITNWKPLFEFHKPFANDLMINQKFSFVYAVFKDSLSKSSVEDAVDAALSFAEINIKKETRLSALRLLEAAPKWLTSQEAWAGIFNRLLRLIDEEVEVSTLSISTMFGLLFTARLDPKTTLDVICEKSFVRPKNQIPMSKLLNYHAEAIHRFAHLDPDLLSLGGAVAKLLERHREFVAGSDDDRFIDTLPVFISLFGVESKDGGTEAMVSSTLLEESRMALGRPASEKAITALAKVVKKSILLLRKRLQEGTVRIDPFLEILRTAALAPSIAPTGPFIDLVSGTLPAIFALPPGPKNDIVAALCEVSCVSSRAIPPLCDIVRGQYCDEVGRTLLLSACGVVPKSRELSRLICELDFDPSVAPEVFKCCEEISKSHSDLSNAADSVCVRFLCDVDEEVQEHFLQSIRGIYTIECVCNAYLDPASSRFNADFFPKAARALIGRLRSLCDGATDDEFGEIVSFLSRCKAAPIDGIEEWPVLSLMGSLGARIMNCPPRLREELSSLLAKAAPDLDRIVI